MFFTLFILFSLFFSHPSFNLFTSLAPFYLLNVMPFSILYVPDSIRKCFPAMQRNIFNVLQVGVRAGVPGRAACIFILTTQHHILFTGTFDKYIYPPSLAPRCRLPRAVLRATVKQMKKYTYLLFFLRL